SDWPLVVHATQRRRSLKKKKIYGGDRDLQETQRQSSIGSCYIAKEELRD
ncbi:unnamed protein product, partial [Brassica oleracea var. botrytis]